MSEASNVLMLAVLSGRPMTGIGTLKNINFFQKGGINDKDHTMLDLTITEPITVMYRDPTKGDPNVILILNGTIDEEAVTHTLTKLLYKHSIKTIIVSGPLETTWHGIQDTIYRIMTKVLNQSSTHTLISGGASGVDTGALLAAEKCGIRTAGFMPEKFKRDGGGGSEIATRFNLVPLKKGGFGTKDRTNIRMALSYKAQEIGDTLGGVRIGVDPSTYGRIRETTGYTYLVTRLPSVIESLTSIMLYDGWDRSMRMRVKGCVEWNSCGQTNYEYSASYFKNDCNKEYVYVLSLSAI
jgi:hypothetical protein